MSIAIAIDLLLFQFTCVTSLFFFKIITMIFQFSLQPLAVIFCGRLGKTELDAVALANSVKIIFCIHAYNSHVF